MRFQDLLSYAAALLTIVVALNFFMFRVDTNQKLEGMDSSQKATLLRAKNMEAKMDSLQANDAIFAKSIIYLDSCQATKTHKADRAEKRGRFLGGLIKGLFPAL
jgi:hypothetical protein